MNYKVEVVDRDMRWMGHTLVFQGHGAEWAAKTALKYATLGPSTDVTILKGVDDWETVN